MSLHKHTWIETREEAERILRDTPKTAEMYALRIMAQRALLDVTTERERLGARLCTRENGYQMPDLPALSAPGSESSERGAKAIEPHRKGQYRTIMVELRKHQLPVSRDELHHRTGIAIASLCGRLKELQPQWIDVVHDACTSDAGVLVDGYVLTEHGRQRMAEVAA